ncbi:MAG: hypothetical protein V3V59_03575 [Thermodesulfovibrionales bacterium]
MEIDVLKKITPALKDLNIVQPLDARNDLAPDGIWGTKTEAAVIIALKNG